MRLLAFFIFYISTYAYADNIACDSFVFKGNPYEFIKIKYDPIKEKNSRHYVVHFDLPNEINSLMLTGGGVSLNEIGASELFTHLKIYEANGQYHTWIDVPEKNIDKIYLIFWYGPCPMQVHMRLNYDEAIKAWGAIHGPSKK